MANGLDGIPGWRGRWLRYRDWWERNITDYHTGWGAMILVGTVLTLMLVLFALQVSGVIDLNGGSGDTGPSGEGCPANYQHAC